MKFNSDFKHDLELGEMAETDFHLMLSEKKIEVKYDRKTKETGNVYIEFESRGKPSGIKTTQADYWTYYIDDDFKTITSYGGSTIDNLVIPLAVYLGFKEIYLLGCDGGWNHFYDEVQKSGKRDWINYKHVIKLLDNYGVKLLNCDHTNYFKELEYVKLEEVLK
mgnify:CR=1 FL=1